MSISGKKKISGKPATKANSATRQVSKPAIKAIVRRAIPVWLACVKALASLKNKPTRLRDLAANAAKICGATFDEDIPEGKNKSTKAQFTAECGRDLTKNHASAFLKSKGQIGVYTLSKLGIETAKQAKNKA